MNGAKRLALSCACFVAASVLAGMDVAFDAGNALTAVRVGSAAFATGGGDLWTAVFAAPGCLTNQVKVLARDAASCSRSESAGVEKLTWRDIPLGGERGVLDAEVTITKRPDGSQAWRLAFANRSRNWRLFSTDFPRLNHVTREGEGDAMLPARELLWGHPLGWYLPDVLDKPDKCDIIRELCTFRQANLDALAYGNLLDELRFEGNVGSKTYEWLGRRPHFRLFDKSFKLPPSKFATMTDVIGNWWRTADGKIVLLAANLTDCPQTFSYRVFGTGSTAELTLGAHELKRVGLSE